MTSLKFELITAEIGSTTTIVTAFDGIGTKKTRKIAQAEHFTTVNEGDVTIGINKCIDDIRKKTGGDVDWEEFVATSSAAGGLRMSVHGLVYDMTVRAAKEAALGAGGIIRHVTAGKIDQREVQKVKSINPNMILLAGGVDYGEKETILHNAKEFAKDTVNVPFVVAGNIAVRDEVCEILEKSGKRVYPTENVYPKVDELNVDPIRDVIQQIFSEHIIHADGMDKIEKIVKRPIIPTPAAVMLTTRLLYDMLGDVVTVDIGGATTDIDSVTYGTPEIQEITISPEPYAKRTVEGDLGVFVNAPNVVESMKPHSKLVSVSLPSGNLDQAQWLLSLSLKQGVLSISTPISFSKVTTSISLSSHCPSPTITQKPLGGMGWVFGRIFMHSGLPWVARSIQPLISTSLSPELYSSTHSLS